ncbi:MULTISPECIES: restriction endonuclease subunit S [Streptomyces]|uniref:Restriction endonuclease subunit S n=2 Tax=Streptomyces TaxID=1883 RepID=A0ABU4K4N7_9ACTN|nr:restriction endonuclease subunit S [Streptomyces roseolus]MDX2292390.1 restriction endonuclease subunit S [Streptomyces roseolus]
MTALDELVPPDGWSRRPLRELCESIQAGPNRRAGEMRRTQADGGVPLVLPRDLRGQRIDTAEAAAVPAIPWERARELAGYELTAGDILLTRTGTAGRCALVTQEHAGWLFHSNLVRLRLPEARRNEAAYLVAYLSATSAQDWIASRTAGGVIPSLSIRTLGELPVLLPPAGEQARIGAVLAALDDKIQAHTDIARATRAYRATLAEALMNGLLRPGDDPPVPS